MFNIKIDGVVVGMEQGGWLVPASDDAPAFIATLQEANEAVRLWMQEGIVEADQQVEVTPA